MIRVLTGDCREVLGTLPDASVHMCCTSPPYYGLRDYGTATWEGGEAGCDHKHQLGGEGEKSAKQNTSAGMQSVAYRSNCRKCGAARIDSQIGLEETPDAYVAKLVAVFREVRRVLADDGTLWLNIGDSYASSTMTGGNAGWIGDHRAHTARRQLGVGDVGNGQRQDAERAGHLDPPGLAFGDLFRPLFGTFFGAIAILLFCGRQWPFFQERFWASFPHTKPSKSVTFICYRFHLIFRA